MKSPLSSNTSQLIITSAPTLPSPTQKFYTMVSMKSIIAVTPIMAHLAAACVPINGTAPPSNGTDAPEFPYPIIGSDDAADIATTGYYINHLSLNTRNLTASLDFYTGVFGLRHLFTLRVSEHFSIAYLSHQHGGKNGTGYQTTAEMLREKNNAQGLLELVHVDIPDYNLPASTARPNTFGHIGMVVPDMKATQARLEAYPGINIVKNSGEPIPAQGEVANATSLGPDELAQLSEEEIAFIMAVLQPPNEDFIFVTDPDGNLIEIQPLEDSELF